MYLRVHSLAASFCFAKNRCCMEPPPSVAVLNSPSVSLLHEIFRKFRAFCFSRKTTALGESTKYRHPRPQMYILAHLWATSLQANLLLHRTTAIRGGFAPPALLKIDGVDTRNTVKKYRRRIFDTLRTLFYRMTQ